MCRSSRGDQSVLRPALSVIRLNCSQTSWSVSGVAGAPAKHEAVLHPRRARLCPVGRLPQDQFPQRLDGDIGELDDSAGLLGLGVPAEPHRAVDGHGARLQVNFGPAEGSCFLGTQATEKADSHVGPQTVSLCLLPAGQALVPA